MEVVVAMAIEGDTVTKQKNNNNNIVYVVQFSYVYEV